MSDMLLLFGPVLQQQQAPPMLTGREKGARRGAQCVHVACVKAKGDVDHPHVFYSKEHLIEGHPPCGMAHTNNWSPGPPCSPPRRRQARPPSRTIPASHTVCVMVTRQRPLAVGCASRSTSRPLPEQEMMSPALSSTLGLATGRQFTRTEPWRTRSAALERLRRRPADRMESRRREASTLDTSLIRGGGSARSARSVRERVTGTLRTWGVLRGGEGVRRGRRA
ncbi:hypothetical protein F751_4209 [Auxenochlorella protothecoides]|uniref:Uncharacterized protein n=1 Tax=Auxenochlorella protothecoides TaxID=3075 RepID=A0A087SA11_AUXPR|nr:hypothetical protein F751_4209 [Auxenochlorella protothecoides]KFM22565.1 hypothetical protein F751_4209 [Auxenochlorella protothecoides]